MMNQNNCYQNQAGDIVELVERDGFSWTCWIKTEEGKMKPISETYFQQHYTKVV